MVHPLRPHDCVPAPPPARSKGEDAAMLVYSLSPSAVRAAAPRLAFGLPTRARAALGALLAAALAAAAFPAPAAAQYFGRNKVQYETFDFRILHTQHFD